MFLLLAVEKMSKDLMPLHQGQDGFHFRGPCDRAQSNNRVVSSTNSLPKQRASRVSLSRFSSYRLSVVSVSLGQVTPLNKTLLSRAGNCSELPA